MLDDDSDWLQSSSDEEGQEDVRRADALDDSFWKRAVAQLTAENAECRQAVALANARARQAERDKEQLFHDNAELRRFVGPDAAKQWDRAARLVAEGEALQRQLDAHKACAEREASLHCRINEQEQTIAELRRQLPLAGAGP